MIHGIDIDFFFKDNKGKKSKTFSSSITTKKIKEEIQEKLNIGITAINPFEVKTPEDYTCPTNGRFLNPKTIKGQIIKGFNRIVLKKQKSAIINILKEIDKNIRDIELIKDEIFIDLGFNELAPIKIIGDGVLNLLAIIISIYDTQNGILLIDEIENGLHFSLQKLLWKYIFQFGKIFNVQIIATTHSYDCIKAFKEVYLEEYINNDDARLFRIERNERDEHKIIKYDTNNLKLSIDEDWEIR